MTRRRVAMPRAKTERDRVFGSATEARAWFLEHRITKCETCGWIPAVVPDFADDLWPLEVHHLKPRCEGGGHALRNLVLLCPNCHHIAQGLDPEGHLPRERWAFLNEFRCMLRNPKGYVANHLGWKKREDDLQAGVA